MRRCARCGAEITLCMGFVLARDFLACDNGLIPVEAVREHCGRCVMILEARGETMEYLRGLT